MPDSTKNNEPDAVNPSSTRTAAPDEAVKQDLPPRSEQEDVKEQSYVWLPNGEVLRVNNEDLPDGSGFGAEFGHWQKGDKVYQIVAVYPVEHTVKG